MGRLCKAYEAVATPRSLSNNFSVTSQNFVCSNGGTELNRRQETSLAEWPIVFVPLVPFDRIAGMLTGD